MADPSYIVDGVLEDSEAWVGIATTTLGSNTAEVTFTSPADGSSTDWSQFMDLVLICYTRASSSGTDKQLNMKLNNDMGGSYPTYNYIEQNIRGIAANNTAYAGGVATASRLQCGVMPAASATANVFGATIVRFFDINSGKNKSGISQSACDIGVSSAQGYIYQWAFCLKSQAPLTEIDLADVTGSGDLLAGSMFSLFGILPRMVA